MSCTIADLAQESPCFDCLSDSENENAYLYLLAKTLAAEGGTDYSSIDDLRAAVKCWCGLGERIEAFKAKVASDLAVRAGVYGSTPTATTIKTATACWGCGVGGAERRAMEIMLLCQLFAIFETGT